MIPGMSLFVSLRSLECLSSQCEAMEIATCIVESSCGSEYHQVSSSQSVAVQFLSSHPF